MDKTRTQVFMLMALSLAAMAMLAFPAAASLTGMQFGFPTLLQKGSTSMFNQDTATATDLESLNIDFPQFNGLMGGSGLPASGITGSGSTMSSALPGMGSLGGLFDLSKFKLH